jgi:hypothetical protein
MGHCAAPSFHHLGSKGGFAHFSLSHKGLQQEGRCCKQKPQEREEEDKAEVLSAANLAWPPIPLGVPSWMIFLWFLATAQLGPPVQCGM